MNSIAGCRLNFKRSSITSAPRLHPYGIACATGCVARLRVMHSGFAPAAALVFLVPCLVEAQGLQEEARRQLELGWTDLGAGVPERALSAADSALRLDPLLYEALVLKGLCYEQLGNPGKARALLIAYLDFTEGFTQRPEAREALERLGTDASGGSGLLAGADSGRAWKWESVERQDADDVSEKLTEEFKASGFVASYEIKYPRGSSEHQIHFPDLGFYFRVDRGGEVKIKGKDGLVRELDEDSWLIGKRSGWNEVQVRFDGDQLTAELNGVEVGPVAVL